MTPPLLNSTRLTSAPRLPTPESAAQLAGTGSLPRPGSEVEAPGTPLGGATSQTASAERGTGRSVLTGRRRSRASAAGPALRPGAYRSHPGYPTRATPRSGAAARLGVLWLLALVTSAAPAMAQPPELERLAAESASDLEKALAGLAAVRQQIEGERLPLARKVAEQEQQLARQRADYTKAQRFQENQLVELNALKTEARARGEEVKYIESLLSEYARAFRSRLAFVEEPRYLPTLEAVAKAEASADATPAERFTQRSVLLTTSLQRAEAALGGDRLEGRAIDAQGRVQSGSIALIGPLAVYANVSGDVVGVLQQELNKAEPTVVPPARGAAEAIRALVTTGTGELALDPTLGNAFKLAALEDTLSEKIAKGGPAMIPLLGLGLAAMIVALVKWIQLGRLHVATEADLQRVLQEIETGDRDRALNAARAIPGPAGDLLATAVEHLDEKKEYIEEVVYEKMLGARARLERGLQFLALTATAGPLLGLLGTVTGMIATFKLISSFGSGDPRLLAAGISEALICTATGMLIAIPSLLFHSFLGRRAKGILGSMEQVAVGFINGIPESYRPTFS